ncbi:type 1 glutamine amidotransferase domain-containing protein [Helicobacter sp. NHP22-001]|uniref:type 1 glutamine amidotransferase domain-containing protein n=1 Tax=Helicobacter sp. NHP22-001 TaxID=3040202 RepID=UPI00244D8F87|nr:type 1 glutamine amidotransferase domain-containing protein [Helicobacter sp. NHP22-001]GMB96299.1 type 1 glutamine amidotransferase domain-containing protein [Helicobacter sp. NHP22-001]
MKKILVIVTNVSKYPNDEKPTGLWLGEAVHFAHEIEKAGYAIDYASPKGGYTPIDPNSLAKDFMSPIDWQYYTNQAFMDLLGNTLPVSALNPKDYAAIYYAGGHGVVWDFPDNTALAQVALDIYNHGGVVSSVCHGAAGLLNIKNQDGSYLIAGKRVTGFSNSEEKALQLDKLVPYLTEDVLVARGAKYEKAADWAPFALSDQRIVTGQNPASSAPVAKQVLELI